MVWQLQEAIERIVVWTKVKCRIQSKGHANVYFKEKEIWWVHLGENVGSEQNGKGDRFDRPALIVHKFGPHLAWVLPVTSGEKTSPFLLPVSLLQNKMNTSVILSQLRTISSKRLIHRYDTISDEMFEVVIARLKTILETSL